MKKLFFSNRYQQQITQKPCVITYNLRKHSIHQGRHVFRDVTCELTSQITPFHYANIITSVNNTIEFNNLWVKKIIDRDYKTR